MAGLYRRATAPNFTSPAMQVAASRGAGGAIPGGGVSVPRGQQDTGMDMGQLGGMLGLLQKMKDKQDPAAAAGDGVHADAGAMANTLPKAAQDVLNFPHIDILAKALPSVGIAVDVIKSQAGALGNGIPAGTGTTPMPAQQIPGGGVGMNPANMPLSGGGIGNAVDSGMGAGLNGIPGTGGMHGGAGGMSNPMTGGMFDPQMLQNLRFFTPSF